MQKSRFLWVGSMSLSQGIYLLFYVKGVENKEDERKRKENAKFFGEGF